MLPVGDYIAPDFKKWLKRKNEIHAHRWAIDKILPYAKITQAIENGCANDWEIAEDCDVMVEFLQKAFEYYRRKGITYIP